MEEIAMPTSHTALSWITHRLLLERLSRAADHAPPRRPSPRAAPPRAMSRGNLLLALEGDALTRWEQAREALEFQAGRTLSERETFELLCAEVLRGHARAPHSERSPREPRRPG
jgi:hypothetical protein